MLVLNRQPEEGLILTLGGPNPITVTIRVLAVEGNRVKLGLDAPREVTILRQELCEAVRDQNLAAARSAGPVPAEALVALRRLIDSSGTVAPQ